MNNGEHQELYSDFNAFYHTSAEFPADARTHIPQELYSAVDCGNIEFFSELNLVFPKLHETLIKSASPVCLLELLSIGMGLDDIGQEYRTYCWGLKCGGKLLTGRIPVAEPSSDVARINATPYLSCLPTEFAAFYNKMDGIAIAEGVGPNGFDFPASFGDWREIRRYMEDLNCSCDTIEHMYRKLNAEDLRVFIKCSNGELVVVDLSSSSKQLYLVNIEEPSYFKKIENSVEVLDTYFANSINGQSSALSQMI